MKHIIYKQLISIILSISLVGTSVPANVLKHSFLAPPVGGKFAELEHNFNKKTTRNVLLKNHRQKISLTRGSSSDRMLSGITGPLRGIYAVIAILLLSILVNKMFTDYAENFPSWSRILFSHSGVPLLCTIWLVSYITVFPFWLIRIFFYNNLSSIAKRVFIYTFQLLRLFNIALLGFLFAIVGLYLKGVKLPVFFTPSYFFLFYLIYTTIEIVHNFIYKILLFSPETDVTPWGGSMGIQLRKLNARLKRVKKLERQTRTSF